MNRTFVVDDNPPLWDVSSDTPLQTVLRHRIGSSQKLSCYWCKMEWTAGPFLRLDEQQKITYCMPYTDVGRRDVVEVAKGEEWPPHLVCRECGEEMITLDREANTNEPE